MLSKGATSLETGRSYFELGAKHKTVHSRSVGLSVGVPHFCELDNCAYVHVVMCTLSKRQPCMDTMFLVLWAVVYTKGRRKTKVNVPIFGW